MLFRSYVLLIAEMMLFHGKHYYPADVYPILIAAGAVPIETWTKRHMFARAFVTAAVVAIGVAFLPTAMPVLSESQFVVYLDSLSRALHISKNATATEHGRENSALPGDWADMHGWPEMASAVKSVYESLPPGERRQAVVFAGNYGEASAVRFFAPGIPVISSHNQYWLWGTRGYSGAVVVQVNGTCFQSDHLFATRTRATTFTNRWAIGYETNIPIWICRGIKKPLAEEWPAVKSYE